MHCENHVFLVRSISQCRSPNYFTGVNPGLLFRTTSNGNSALAKPMKEEDDNNENMEEDEDDEEDKDDEDKEFFCKNA